MSENDDKTLQQGGAEERQQALGLAGRMARAFIHSPLSPLLFFAMLAMGVLGLIFTPRQEDPQISVPMVDIYVAYPGASSSQVASLAIDPLERIMSEIPGVKHVYSASRHSQGIVTVQFKVGEHLGPSIVKVHDKIQSNLDKIPPGVQMPLVKPKGIDDVPVVTLTLWSDIVDDGMMRTLALDLLQNLKQIPNTGQGFIVGGRSEQVRVEVLPERLSGFGISLDQVANTIRTANSEQMAGSVESGNQYYTVNTGAFLTSAEDVGRLVVTTQHGTPVYVRDVARVTQGPSEANQLVQYYTGPAYAGEGYADGASAVTVAISKKEGTNGVSVATDIIERVESLRGRLIPENVQVEITRDYGKTANDKVNDLIKKLFIATGLVGLLVLISLGRRPAMVVLLVIPVVILITVFSAMILGLTIDRVSLFALIFSIGILVDDAIVVVENIYRRWLEKGTMDTETAVDAVREVGNPTILATFTVIAALLPMGFVSGMMGPYMAPIPTLGSVAMFFSLFAAFAFTPWLVMRLRPSMAFLKRQEEKEHASNARLEQRFRNIITPIVNDRKRGFLTLGIILALFFISCAFFYTKWVTVKMLPLDNKPEFSITVDLPEGSALPQTANLTSRLAEVLREFPEVTALQTYAGIAQPFDFNGMVRHYYLRQDPWQGEVHVQLLDKRERDRSSHEVALEAREKLTPIAREMGARITIVEMPPGPPVLQAMVAEIYGPDAETRREVATRMTEIFEQAEGVGDVDNYMQQPYYTWRFEVDTEKAVRRGISVDTINRNLTMAMGGHKLGDIKQGTVLDPTYIVMQVPFEIRAETARLGELPIPTTDGTTVPLAELGRFHRVLQDPIIYHKDLRPIEYVVGEAIGDLAAPIYGMFTVEDMLKDYTTPDGEVMSGEMLGPPAANGKSAFEWTGEWTVTYETFRDMGAAFGVALILIYILVVWEFGNFVVPAVIMAPIPLTLIGIIPGHWLMGAEFTATSMIGFIALAGIIVRNSILLVDFTINQVKKGVDVREAVILSCKARTRPILITAGALVGGSGVILFDPIFQGMAISLMFGVLVSTLLTLIVIPLGCISARAYFCPAGGGGVVCEAPVGGAETVADTNNGVSITDLAIGFWRLFMMMAKGLLFRFWSITVSAIFALIDMWQRRKAAAVTSDIPTTTTTQTVASAPRPDPVTAPKAPQRSPEARQASEPVVAVKSDSNDKAENMSESEVGAKTDDNEVAAAKSSVETVVHDKVAVSDEVIKQKIAPKKNTVKKKVVKKSPVKKKSVTKKKITLKKSSATRETPAENSVAIKEGGAKESKGRRGIRLKNFDDDFNL
ncbi:MAG: efflux RND transporter permease subunit [Chromatiales bacterium]|nr:efflux RND transporter permease subunit [Chromatiales bacterium]